MEAGLLNWSIQCEYRDHEGLELNGVTFVNNGGVLLYVRSEGQGEVSFARSIGRVLNTLYIEGAATFLTR